MAFSVARFAQSAALCGLLTFGVVAVSATTMPAACIVPPLDPMPRISSGFGPRGLGFHAGIDLPAVTGTPVLAVAPGEIARAAYHPTFGRLVVQRLGPGSGSGKGVYAVYAHLHRTLVAPGDVVDAGTPVGTVGSTGRSTGPHLHFSILVDVPDARLRSQGSMGVRERDYAIDPERVPGCVSR